jgi:hypothetical protein
MDSKWGRKLPRGPAFADEILDAGIHRQSQDPAEPVETRSLVKTIGKRCSDSENDDLMGIHLVAVVHEPSVRSTPWGFTLAGKSLFRAVGTYGVQPHLSSIRTSKPTNCMGQARRPSWIRNASSLWCTVSVSSDR